VGFELGRFRLRVAMGRRKVEENKWIFVGKT
jgi:hypothetical protein